MTILLWNSGSTLPRQLVPGSGYIWIWRSNRAAICYLSRLGWLFKLVLGVSVGTNGVCVVEHADNYIPVLLQWSGTLTGWNHIAVVYTAKQSVLYINGVYTATGFTSPRLQVAASYTTVGGGGYGYYSGQLDELRIWNTSRTASQIFNNYNTPVSLPDADLKVYLKIEEGSGDSTADASGNANNGTLVNNPVWIAQDVTPPTITCPSAATVNAANGLCTAVVNFAAPSINDDCPSSVNGSQTFTFTGGAQTWTVPAGVSEQVTVDLTGAEGGQEINSYSGVLGGVRDWVAVFRQQ